MQPASLQRWLFALVTVSVLGTLLAGATLMVDGWIDALSLYVACVFLLVLMLHHIAGQQMQPRPAAFAGDGRADPGSRPASLALTGAPGTWGGTDHAAVPAAFGSAPSTD